MFECPAVQCVRDKYAHLFSPLVQIMQQFFWQEDTQSVVHFIRECLCMMLPATVACHCCCWMIHLISPYLAGTDVTFLPSCAVKAQSASLYYMQIGRELQSHEMMVC